MKIELHEPQFNFIQPPKGVLDICYIGGVGSGKTFIGTLAALKEIEEFPNSTGLIAACTYRQLNRATLRSFLEHCKSMHIYPNINKREGELQIGNATVYLNSLENPEPIQGMWLDWALLDEVDFASRDSINIVTDRMRGKEGARRMYHTSSPNGYGAMYEKFVLNKCKENLLVHSSTYMNKHNLPPDYIPRLERTYDDKMAQQQIYGKFINTRAGLVYHAFHPGRHVQETLKTFILPSEHYNKIYVGMDFNVDPMTAVICTYNEYDKSIQVFDEVYLNNSNTFQACEHIRNKYGAYKITVVPDSTSIKRTSNAVDTDYEIIKQYGFDVVWSRNPPKQNRYNCVNKLFNENLIQVDNDCKFLIRDLNLLSHKNQDQRLGHITDALGYLCWHLNPIGVKVPEAKIIDEEDHAKSRKSLY